MEYGTFGVPYNLGTTTGFNLPYANLTVGPGMPGVAAAPIGPSAFAPTAFAPTAYAPTAFAPTAFAPTAYAPTAFAPTGVCPAAVSRPMAAVAAPITRSVPPIVEISPPVIEVAPMTVQTIPGSQGIAGIPFAMAGIQPVTETGVMGAPIVTQIMPEFIAPQLAAALPVSTVAAPIAGYGVPATYAAPVSYGAPFAGYGAPFAGYGVPFAGYGAATPFGASAYPSAQAISSSIASPGFLSATVPPAI